MVLSETESTFCVSSEVIQLEIQCICKNKQTLDAQLTPVEERYIQSIKTKDVVCKQEQPDKKQKLLSLQSRISAGSNVCTRE